MQSYEAVRWALDRLNKENEMLNGEFLDDTYIPGVKIGKNIIFFTPPYDTSLYFLTLLLSELPKL